MGKVGAVVVAAGKGSRMGTEESKQYLLLQGKPILVHTLELFQKAGFVDSIAIVVGGHDLDRCRGWVDEYGLSKVAAVVAGGRERQESVMLGLSALSDFVEWVMVHDGVRPFVTEAGLLRCLREAERSGAAVLAVPVKDTIKQVDESGIIRATPDRRSLWAIQTPQAFRMTELIRAHEQAVRDGYIGTDDAVLVERLGHPVRVVEGEYGNIKITTPDDLLLAEFLLQSRERGER